MQKYIENYITHYNICEQDIMLCKICSREAVDIHHIVYRSQGGSDEVDNLVALCRQCHYLAHDKKLTNEELYEGSRNSKINS